MLFMSLKRRCGDWGSRGTRDEQAASDGSPVRLKRRVVGARDVKQTAGVFRSLFGFQEVAMNDGPRTMLAVGRGAILIVPSEEVGGTEGMVALSLVALDFESLMAAFDPAGTKCLRGTGEGTLEPASSHGVHLHISRYE